MKRPLSRHTVRTSGRVGVVAALCLSLVLAAGGVEIAGAGSTATSASHQEVERAVRECANRNRRAAGLEPLHPSRVLSQAARLQARNMARHDFFDHTDQQGRDVAERVEIFDRQHRYTLVGENIAAGYGSARLACDGWMHSSGHRANILGQGYTAIGTGFAVGGEYGRYYVQVFAK
jgi:uncharacterized protein YkwD